MNTYRTHGTCSQVINFEVENNIIKSVEFVGGCSGNTQGVARLVEGKNIDEVIKLLKGIDCAGRGTSCPDQVAIALEEYKNGK